MSGLWSVKGLLPGKIACDRPDDCLSDLVAVSCAAQIALVCRVGQITQLDQDRGNVGRLQNREAGEAMSAAQQLHFRAQLFGQDFGEYSRFILRITLGEVYQNVGDLSVLDR